MSDTKLQSLIDDLLAHTDDTTVHTLVGELRTTLARLAANQLAIRSELRKLKRQIEKRDHTVGAKLHMLSNFMMGLEERLAEIADVVTDSIEDPPLAKQVNGDM